MKYYILDSEAGDPITKKVIEVRNGLSEAYVLWLENPAMRKIVKEVEVVVEEK